jgi:hypothetical protein
MKKLGTCQQQVNAWNTSQAGCVRDTCFSGVITLGNASSGGKTVKFTSALAIDKFLPASGTAGIFNVNLINPLTTSAGVFAGQLLTAMLNQVFSGNSFSSVFFSTTCTQVAPVIQGLSVAQVIYISNQVIAGLPGYSQYSPSVLNTALSVFNSGFDGCKQNTTTKACFFCLSSGTVNDDDLEPNQEPSSETSAPSTTQSHGVAIFIGVFVGVMLFLILVTCLATRFSNRSASTATQSSGRVFYNNA